MPLDLDRATLGGLLSRNASRWPEKTAMIGEHRTWTWAELDAEVDAVAVMWERAGLRPGDAVAFVLNKRPEVVIGFLACARAGMVYAPVNHKLPAANNEDQLRTANVAAMVLQHELDRELAGIAELPAARWYVGPEGIHGGSLWADHERFAGQKPRFEADPDTVCYYNYTSGSTGRPKGAVTTHRNVLVNAVATAEGLGFRADDVYLGMFSVFAHPHELFHRSILDGGAFVILDTLSPRIVAETIARHRVTWMMAVPSFYEMLLESRNQHSHDLGSLRVLESGGAYVSGDTLARMEEAFSAVFLPVWGSTETTGVGLGMAAGGERRDGSTGRVIPGYEIKVLDESGALAAVGEVGELHIRGPAVVSGYVGQPEETAQQFSDGWYATRDLVRVDADGFVWFSGRRSEMLKIGGIRVFPLQIEVVLKQHPEVRDVVVVRAEERLRGEIARAILSTVSGSSLTIRGVQAWCRERLALYMVPRIVEFWAEVPKLPNGKIDKRRVLDVAPDPGRDERTLEREPS